MDRAREKNMTGKIFENILFLAEVFGERPNHEIPNIPVLELARGFELSQRKAERSGRRRHKTWALWK